MLSSIFRSIPAYKSSVFSLITVISTFSYRVFMLFKFLASRTEAYKSSSFLKATFTLLKPLPIGVVQGALSAILFFFILSMTSPGKGVPYSLTASKPAS